MGLIEYCIGMISFEENINVIYADNAATTKMSEKAVETMISLISTTYGNASSLYGPKIWGI